MKETEDNWNIFIIRYKGIYKAFTAYGDKGYDNFLEMCKTHGLDIVESELELAEEEMNHPALKREVSNK